MAEESTKTMASQEPQVQNTLAPVKKIQLYDILSQTWSLAKTKVWNLLGINIITLVIAVMFVIVGGIPAVLLAAIFSILNMKIATAIIISLLLIYGAFVLFVAISWQMIASIKYLAANNEDKSIKDLLLESKPDVKRLFPTIGILFLIIIGGYALFLIPAIIFGISLTFVIFIAVLENKSTWESVRASRDLVRGRWWNLFFLFIGFAIVWILAILTTGMYYSPLMIIFAPLYMIFMYIIYNDVKNTGPAALPTSRGVWYYQIAAVIGGIILVGFGVFASYSFASEILNNNSGTHCSKDRIGCNYNPDMDCSIDYDGCRYDDGETNFECPEGATCSNSNLDYKDHNRNLDYPENDLKIQ